MSTIAKMLLGKFFLNQAKKFDKNSTAQKATSIVGLVGSAAVITKAVKNLKRKGAINKISNIATIGSAALGIAGTLKYLFKKKPFFRKKKKFAII